MNKLIEKIGKVSLAMMLSIPTLGSGITAFAQEGETESTTDGETQVSTSYPEAQDGYTYVSSVASYSQEENSVTLNLEAGERIRFTFLENNVFRMYMAAPGDEFQEYPTPNSSDHTATITDKSDDEYYTEYNVVPTVTEDDSVIVMMTDSITITIDKATSMMTVTNASGATVLKESAPIQYRSGSTIQTLATSEFE